MNENLHRASIVPITDSAPRPLWSVMIPTYNCASYLRETLSTVLVQDPGAEFMQIEVVDDHSTLDNPEAIVSEIGGSRVNFFRQPQNVGYIRNFETCLQRSRGHLIHLLHGDDCVRNGFYHRMAMAFEKDPEIGAAFCRHIYMDEQGHWQSLSPLEQGYNGRLENWLEKISSGQRLATPSVVVRRDVYEKLEGFDRRMSCAGEDWEMWVRIATQFPVWFETEPLALYRTKRPGSLTQGVAHTNRLVRDMRVATDIIKSYLFNYLPPGKAQASLEKARAMYALWALQTARQAYDVGDLRASLVSIWEAVQCDCSVRTTTQAIRLALKVRTRQSWRSLKRIKNLCTRSKRNRT
jgi:glycosyltransferase involved in cell wall biosynthesis